MTAVKSATRWHGLIAAAYAPGSTWPTLDQVCSRLEAPQAAVSGTGQFSLAAWGSVRLPDSNVILLAHEPRCRESPQDVGAVGGMLVSGDRDALAQMMPTFAALALTSREVIAAADPLGFRQLYYVQTRDGAAVGTSSRALGALVGSGVSLEGIAVQAFLGWQLGQRTINAGITKLEPGALLTLRDGIMASEAQRHEPGPRLSLTEAVGDAAKLLRTWMEAYLEEKPDAALQLTGGQDSRLLLSAIPKERRRGVHVVTLGRPGSADVDIASDLARQYELKHELISLDGLEEVTPLDAYLMCVRAAEQLDGMADPLALASLTYAESRAEGGPRISGLGGEVARGFYYFGRGPDSPVTMRRAASLASWRMFTNESVPTEALSREFHDWAQDYAARQVFQALRGSNKAWNDATDALYLRHRMQRWAGVTETAVCLDRVVVNPMLDDRFIAIAQRLPHQDKANSRFLSSLQMALDEELGAQPLDGRPPPRVYATPTVANSVRVAGVAASKIRRKAMQRLRGARRPPAGGEILARKVVEHLRSHPTLLDGVASWGIFDKRWVDDVISGNIEASTSAVALMINLILSQSKPLEA